jgi:hypothetical protein
MNKMGSLKTITRNTDATKILDSPLEMGKRKRQEMINRTQNAAGYFVKVVASGLLIAALFLIITNQATDLFQMQASVAPWMKSHRIVFPATVQAHIDNIKASLNRAVVPTTPAPTPKKQKMSTDKRKHKTESQRNKGVKQS